MKRSWARYGLVMGLLVVVTVVPALAIDTTWTFNGDGGWHEVGKWSNGEPNNDTFNVFIDDGDTAVNVTLTNTSRTIGSLTLGADDTLTLLQSGLTSANAFTNDGTIVHNGNLLAVGNGAMTNSATGLLNFKFGSTFRGDLANLGVIAVDGRTTFDKSNGQYTNYGQFVLSNHGTLSSTITNGGQFINQGEFTVTNTAGFTVAEGSTFEQSAGVLDVGVVNSGGNFTLDAGSTLNLSGGALNINYQLHVNNGSTLNFTGGALNLNENGYLYIRDNSSLNLPSGTTLDVNGSLQFIDGGTLNLTTGTLNLNGSMSVQNATVTVPTGLTLNVHGNIGNAGSADSGAFRLNGGTLNYTSGLVSDIEYLSGTISGAPQVRRVTIGEMAANPATFVFGATSHLQGNAHEGQTLILQGTEGVSGPCFFTSDSFTNYGTIVLTSSSTTYAWLNVNDTLTNGPTGLLHVQVGSNAGQRNFTGNLVNYGTVQLDRRTNFSTDFIENHGEFTVGAGVILANNSASTRFDQLDGVFDLIGIYRQEAGGSLNLRGGVLKVYPTTGWDPDGAFTFDGGTMQIQSSFDVPALRSIALEGAGGTVDTNGFSSTVLGVISGTGSLKKIGAGTLTLSGSNSYSGGTVLDDGALSIANDGNVGGAATPVTFQGGILRVTGTVLTNLNSHVVNWSTFDGGFDIADANHTFTVSQDISGAGSLTKAGPGTLVLSGNNTYTGVTNINGGTLRTSGGNAVPDLSPVTLANTAGAVLDLNGTSEIIGGLAGGGGIGGNVTLGAGTLAVNQSGNSTYAGVISGSGSVIKTGPGLLTLSGTNTYSGGTTLSAGGLSIANVANFAGPTSQITFSGGHLRVTGTSVSNLDTNTVNWATFDGGFDIADTNHTFVVSQGIGGAGSLTKAGPGNLTLSGNSSYTGTSTIKDGMLTVTNSSALGAIPGGDVFVENGGSLNLGGGFAGENTINFGQKVFHISGDGGGKGAFTNRDLAMDSSGNTGAVSQFSALRGVVLDADAMIGGPGQGPDGDGYRGRLDIRGTMASHAQLDLGGHTLTKFGPSLLALVNVDVVGAGDIAVTGADSTLNLELSTIVQPNGGGKIFFGDDAMLQFWNVTAAGATRITRPIEMGDGLPSSKSFIGAGGAASSVGSPILLKGDLIVRPNYFRQHNFALTLIGDISEDLMPRAIIKRNPGTLVLSGNNSFTGGLEISPGTSPVPGDPDTGIVQISSAASLDPTNVVSFAPAAGFTGILRMGSNLTVAGLEGDSLAGTAIVEKSSAGPSTLTVDNVEDWTFNGTLQDGTGIGRNGLLLTKAGTGTLILGGTNTYTGATMVKAGTLLVNGTHTGLSPYLVDSGAALGGTGSISPLVEVSGTLAPGASAGSMSLGSLTMHSGSTLEIELGGTTQGSQYDHVSVASQLALDGTLQISLIDGFMPDLGLSFDILDWNSLGGVFDALALPTLPTDRMWNLSQLYSTGSLSVSLSGDFDGDGTVGHSDRARWAADYGVNGNSDANGDGRTDGRDYLIWQRNLGKSVMPMSANNVPEPSAASALCVLLAFGTVVFRTPFAHRQSIRSRLSSA